MTTPEWIELKCGSVLHSSTVDHRQTRLGWSGASAKSVPIRHNKGRLGKPNIAARARADRLTPIRVQQLMRRFDATYEVVRDYLRRPH